MTLHEIINHGTVVLGASAQHREVKGGVVGDDQPPVKQLRDPLPTLWEVRSVPSVRRADAVDHRVEAVVVVAGWPDQQVERVRRQALLEHDHTHRAG